MNVWHWLALLLGGQLGYPGAIDEPSENLDDCAVITVCGDLPDVCGECLDVELNASRTYSPSSWQSGDLCLGREVGFEVPAKLDVVDGNAGDQWATLDFLYGWSYVSCWYVGGSNTSHPTAPADVEDGLTYWLDGCTDGSVAGDSVSADYVSLHVYSADSSLARTEVVASLVESDATCVQELPPPPMCADGTFGNLPDPSRAFFVSANGDDGATGAADAPFATLSRAIAAVRAQPAGAERVIGVGPGSFPAAVALDGRRSDAGATAIYGCGAAETSLVAATGGLPVLAATGGADLFADGLALVGGSVGAKATLNSELTLNQVEVRDASLAGVYVMGKGSSAILSDVDVKDPAAGETCSIGVWVQDGHLLWSGGGVTDASGFAVLLDNAVSIVDDVVITGTRTGVDGRFGRGFSVDGGQANLTRSSFVDNQDASVFVRQPEYLLINGIAIDITGAGVIGTSRTGDGIVILQSGSGVRSPRAVVQNNMVTNSARAALLVSDSDVELDGNLAGSSGVVRSIGSHAISQGAVQISGTDAALVTWLGPTDVMALDVAAPACVEP